MINANEARELMKNSFRAEAVQYAIENISQYIKERATQGYRSCIVTFNKHPNTYANFIKKYGKERHDDYKTYDVEKEIKEHFTKQGFTFKLITDDICGGVRQSPYWTICW